MLFHQQCLYGSKTYSYIGTYITHLRRNHKERIVHLSVKQQPEDGFAIEHGSLLRPFVNELHCDPWLHTAEVDSSNTYANSENVFTIPE